MPDLNSLADRLHYDGHREYTNVQGNIAYLDSARLARPADMPRVQRVIALVIVAIAIVIGLVFINNTVIARIQATASAEQAISENMQRQASIETIPQMSALMTLDNDSIKKTFADAGYTIYDASATDDSNDLVLYKIPGDMSLSDASVMYQRGIGSLNAEQASRLLVGSWYFAADRVNGTSMVVRYADFATNDPQIAVQTAISKEGFDAKSVSNTGVDDSGNTFSEGTLEIDGNPYIWKVSALPLDEMYSISGLPEGGCYVGIRVTAQ